MNTQTLFKSPNTRIFSDSQNLTVNAPDDLAESLAGHSRGWHVSLGATMRAGGLLLLGAFNLPRGKALIDAQVKRCTTAGEVLLLMKVRSIAIGINRGAFKAFNSIFSPAAPSAQAEAFKDADKILLAERDSAKPNADKIIDEAISEFEDEKNFVPNTVKQVA